MQIWGVPSYFFCLLENCHVRRTKYKAFNYGFFIDRILFQLLARGTRRLHQDVSLKFDLLLNSRAQHFENQKVFILALGSRKENAITNVFLDVQ